MKEEQQKFKIEKQEAKRDIYQAGRNIIIQQPSEREKFIFPFPPSLHNQTPPEPNFVGRKEMLATITEWYKNSEVRIGAIIGWGGVGKSALVRKWYNSLEANNIKPNGVFWWGFYRNANLEQFLNALLRYVTQWHIKPDTIKSTWEKINRIKEYIYQGTYLIILDGLEQVQKSASGYDFGRMIHRECTELLHYLADASKAEGLCLITTRYPLKDLENWRECGYREQLLIDLSISDSLLLLKRQEVEGSDEDKVEVISRYKGHALSLTSLAGYLKRYYVGDIKHAPKVEFVLGDKERFKDVNKLLRKYKEKMSDSERILLHIFSLFRQEITENDFTGVFQHEIEDTKFNDVLLKMSKLDFIDILNGLVDWRLISFDKTKKTYTTHPLIKGYFESTFDEKNKKLCHKRIYKYFGEYAPEQPETLDEMQPLFEQVYHGCSAALYDEVYHNVFWSKIDKMGKHFLYFNLSSWYTEISLLLNFFPSQDFSQMPSVSKKKDQSLILNELGISLVSVGRPTDAEELLTKEINMEIELKSWGDACAGYSNLIDLQLRTGKLIKGMESGRNGIKISLRTKNKHNEATLKSYYAYVLFLLGETKEAIRLFEEGNEIFKKIHPNVGGLYGFSGVHYADLLIHLGIIDKATEVSTKNFKCCLDARWPDLTEFARRSLAAIERIKGNYNKSNGHLQTALESARNFGIADLENEVLIEFGKLHLDMEKHEDAIRDANEVLKICTSTGFKLYEPEAMIVLSKAYLALNDLEHAKTFAHSVYEKAINMHNRWAEGNGAHLLGEIYLTMGDRMRAREYIDKTIACRKEILDPNLKDSETVLERL